MRLSRDLRAAAFLAGLAAAAPFTALPAAGQELRFTDSTTMVTRLDALHADTGAAVVVFNRGPADVRVGARVEGLRGSPGGRGERWAPAGEDSVLIPARSAASLHLFAPRSSRPDSGGVYTGVVVVAGGRTRIAKQIRIVVPPRSTATGSSPASAIPAAVVSTWEAQVYRRVPLPRNPFLTHAPLPARADTVPPIAALEPMVLTREGGGALVARADSVRRWDADTTAYAFQLALAGPARSGTYTGKAVLGGDTTAVTIVVKDSVGWAVVVIFLGVLVAFLTQGWASVRKPLLVADARSRRLASDLEAAEKRFGELLPGRAFTVDAADVANRRAELARALSQLSRSVAPMDDSNGEYTAFVGQLDAFAGQVKGWPALADALRMLEAAVGRARAEMERVTPPRTPDGIPSEPLVLARAEALLAPRKVKLGEVPGLVEEVKSAAAGVEAWTRVLSDAGRMQEWLRGVKADRDELEAVRDPVERVVAGLWYDDDLVVSDGTRFATLLEAAREALLATLNESAPAREETAAVALEGLESAALRDGRQVRIENLQMAGAAPRQDGAARERDSAARVDLRVIRGDVAYAALSLAVSLVVVLNESYVGKPFGSINDYVTVFLGGYAVKSGLEIALGAVARIRALKLPL